MGLGTSASFVQLAREFFMAVSGDLDQYTTRKGIIEVESPFQVSLFTPSHIQFAKYGRKAGKKPPLDPILDWVKAKNITFGNKSERGTAFAIQAMIGNKGTIRGRANSNPPNALEEAIEKNFIKFSEKLALFVTIEINDEVNKIYKQVIPEKIDYKF